MIKTICVAAAGAALMAGTSAASAKDAAVAAPADKLICQVKPRTGTRFATKTCHTKTEWETIAEASKRSAAEMMNRPAISIDRGN